MVPRCASGATEQGRTRIPGQMIGAAIATVRARSRVAMVPRSASGATEQGRTRIPEKTSISRLNNHR